MARMVFCNKCGRQFGKVDDISGFHHSGRFGYGSKYDGEEFEMDLCVECIDEFADACELSPINMLPKEWEEHNEY